MDLLLQGVQNKQNVIVTSMRGLERSRFLLRSELILLSTDFGPKKISKIYHVLDKDQSIDRVHYEATQMPFGEFGDIVVSKHDSSQDKPQLYLYEGDESRQLVICHLKYIFDKTEAPKINFDPSSALVVFDGITLENLEGACCEAQEQGGYQTDNSPFEIFSPGLSFGLLAASCWSTVLACNPPIHGLEVELGCKFHIVISVSPVVLQQPRYKVFSSILPRGVSYKPFKFGGLDMKIEDDKSRLHSDSGTMLETLSKQLESGGIVVFFPSYGKMVEYHNAWQQSGVFDRISLPYGRENRGGDHFKNSLIKLAKNRKSILLCSIRYHKDEDLAEFVMAQARAVIVVGLPYLFMNETWYARFNYNSSQSEQNSNRLNGQDLHKYRAIEFLNGIVKRCLNEYRFRDCSFFFLDEALEYNRDKLAAELGDVPVESFCQAVARHQSF